MIEFDLRFVGTVSDIELNRLLKKENREELKRRMEEFHGVKSMSEMDKLDAYLKEKGANYLHYINPKEIDKNGYVIRNEMNKIVVNDEDGNYLWDAICHYGSYGYEEGLLEIYGSIVDIEKENDSVVGWLTAEDVIKRIEQHT